MPDLIESPPVGSMLAFLGEEPPAWIEAELRRPGASGVTLFREHNIVSASQVRRLTERLREVNEDLLVAVDQEGGQLLGAGADTTPFPGNMALGAAGEAKLAREVGTAIGLELGAMGINVNYAPVCDIAGRPGNPSLGTRSFGGDPEKVAMLVAAFVDGLQGAGVAATLKHFPGKGEAEVDPHFALPVLDLDRERFEAVEWLPFQAGIEAGARLLMCGHYAAPSLTGSPTLPFSRSARAMREVVRGSIGFDGVVITDALDMAGLSLGDDPAAAVDTAVAGMDLLLFGPDRESYEATRDALAAAVAQGRITPQQLDSSHRRTRGLVTWLGRFATPGLEVVGADRHAVLAAEVARRAVTLVRDRAGLLPLRVVPDRPIAAVMPRPRNLTPADTSRFEQPSLADALRRYHPDVVALTTDHPPTSADIDGILLRARECGTVVVGTIAADLDPAQAELVRRLHRTNTDVITVALATPYDLLAYPDAGTHLCTYSLVRPSLEALADIVFGKVPAEGRLPVAIPGEHPLGHRAAR